MENNAAKTKVREILEDYIRWLEVKESKEYVRSDWKYKDAKRLEFDNDAKYYKDQEELKDEDALHADTIFSFWTPYKTLLLRNANWTVSKTVKSINALLEQSDATHPNKITSKILEVNTKIEAFASVCYTRGNYMLLPKREMNNYRYQVTEDRIDMTLYEAFDKGALSKFFPKENDLYKWIEKENLLSLFVDNEVSRTKINWLINENNPKLISEMSAKEIYSYLKEGTEFIAKRNIEYSIKKAIL